MYLVSFYVPIAHKESVKLAMFHAGAGKIDHYDYCSFETVGLGQFRPLAGSHPFVGKLNTVEIVDEVKIEMVCKKESLDKVINALKNNHPYEMPAYHVVEILNI